MNISTTKNLNERSARLGAVYNPDRFAEEASTATLLLQRHLERAISGTGPVWPAISPEILLEDWPDPETGPRADASTLLAEIIAGSTCQHHPGFVGQQISAPPPTIAPIAMVTAILNNSAAIFEGAPVAVAMEHRLVSWMVRKVGYGEASGGALTSGGTLGTLTALAAMRQAKAGGDPWRTGLVGSERHAVFISEQAHYCNGRALAVLGLGEEAAIPVPTDRFYRMNIESLRPLYNKSLDQGLRPIGVIANAGSTSSGSHDDLRSVASFSEEFDLWFHVDAAHGGSALLSPKYAPLLSGIERADSVVWDAHKMMSMPSLCTAVLFKEAKYLDSAFRQEASYLFSDTGAPWHQPAARNFETTKPTFVFSLYVALRTLGIDFFTECLEYSYDLARAFAAEVDERQAFELLLPPESNIVCFRLKAPAEESDALQLAIRDTVNRRGRFFIMRTVLEDQVWLRVVLMNPLTRLADLGELLDELVQLS